MEEYLKFKRLMSEFSIDELKKFRNNSIVNINRLESNLEHEEDYVRNLNNLIVDKKKNTQTEGDE
ncbi:MAG: hypothetical protein ACTSVR_04840 [Candidatus Thorarchaeota archaeon]